MFKFLKKFRRKKYHEILKLINKGDLYFDIGAHLGEKSKPFMVDILAIYFEAKALLWCGLKLLFAGFVYAVK